MAAKVEIYTSSFCSFCASAKRLLNAKNIDYTEIDVTFDATTRQAMTKRAGGRTSVPQIFIDGEGIGGSDDLYDLDSKDELDALLGIK